eukprot:2803502-Rhodomonas_salina.4
MHRCRVWSVVRMARLKRGCPGAAAAMRVQVCDAEARPSADARAAGAWPDDGRIDLDVSGNWCGVWRRNVLRRRLCNADDRAHPPLRPTQPPSSGGPAHHPLVLSRIEGERCAAPCWLPRDGLFWQDLVLSGSGSGVAGGRGRGGSCVGDDGGGVQEGDGN